MRRGRKVLVVDDNSINIEIYKEMLAHEFAVRTALTATQALQIARDFQPRVILLDVMLPDLDGYETCRRLRREPGLAQAKIFMVSAKAMPSERQAGFDAGADDYVTKPFDEAELVRLIRCSLASFPAEAEHTADLDAS